MLVSNSVAILVYGEQGSQRNALEEEKYKDLAIAFLSQGYIVESILYCDEIADQLVPKLLQFNAVLVWVNPIEQRKDRTQLDKLLAEISSGGCMVSTHPEVILKMGTKDVLYATRNMDWGCDTRRYSSFEEFAGLFPESVNESKTRVLKQYRGNGGKGVYKVSRTRQDGNFSLVHAAEGDKHRVLTLEELLAKFQPFFSNQGVMIDQEWNRNARNGMVRCYVSGVGVAGFGYQEINALYDFSEGENEIYLPPSKRYYFTERCGLFRDLKEIMERKWILQLQTLIGIADHMMPVIWDADFFINGINTPVDSKYTLCEINVSCVSPFPPSAIKFIIKEVDKRINRLK
jgi:hypothetical protein